MNDDPNLQWDGQQWLRWDGVQWVPAMASSTTGVVPPLGDGSTPGGSSHKGLIIGIVVIVCVLVLAGGFALVAFKGKSDAAPSPTPTPTPTLTATVTPTPTATVTVTAPPVTPTVPAPVAPAIAVGDSVYVPVNSPAEIGLAVKRTGDQIKYTDLFTGGVSCFSGSITVANFVGTLTEFGESPTPISSKPVTVPFTATGKSLIIDGNAYQLSSPKPGGPTWDARCN
ncbi:MAG: hypothetical protein WCP28_01205 [Actinomycetes bacterium]